MSTEERLVDVVVVGAGFAGLYALHRLRASGLSVQVLEAAGDVGGTWYWNRYPGARCDIESVLYSYSFSPELEQEWVWTERYPTQPEILRYLNHVADRFDLRRDVAFDTRVSSAVLDPGDERWIVTTEAGARYRAQFVVMATGCLSEPKLPDLPGLEAFTGRVLRTARWPHEEVDFTGTRVGVIGTGSSGIQSIPRIAEQAAALTVFQRTPHFSVPARNAPLDPAAVDQLKAEYPGIRQQARDSAYGIPIEPTELSQVPALTVPAEDRNCEFERLWAQGGLTFLTAFADLALDREANETAAAFVRGKIRELVHDPAVAERLLPTGYPIGTKRLCLDTDYYATFNRDNVTLVDIRADPIAEFTPTGLRTAGGAEHGFDILVLATGFDAMTGALTAIDIRGRDGISLRDKWSGGARAYLGVASAGFPNLFMVTGPGSPSVLSNMVVSIEQHIDWIAALIDHIRGSELWAVEATVAAEDGWVAHVAEVGNYTLWPQADSWYMGSNVPGKARVLLPYLGGVNTYRQTCDKVAADGYAGFTVT